MYKTYYHRPSTRVDECTLRLPNWSALAGLCGGRPSIRKRIVFTEFIGYLDLTAAKETLDPRSFALGTFAICGFANFASIAIQIEASVQSHRNAVKTLHLSVFARWQAAS